MYNFAKWCNETGMLILPYSFAFYFPVRWFEYLWNMGYTRLVKGIWYLALGLTYVTDGIGADVIVTYICFIEACDLFFQQLEIGKERKTGMNKNVEK